MPDSPRPLFIPVVIGTARQGRASEDVARFVMEAVRARPGVETQLVDVREIRISVTDAGESIEDAGFGRTVLRADGLILVVPEYNHGYPGLLKCLLDTIRKEYIHKAVGICGVSAGPWGGTRVIENLLPVLRELGLVTIFWDGNFANVGKLFDAKGAILDATYERRIDKFLKELIWMATVLRHGRENVPLP